MRLSTAQVACFGGLACALALVLVASCSLVVDTSGLANGVAASGDAGSADGSNAPDSSSGGDGAASTRCTRDAGPSMVDLGIVCIDATEVTAKDFALFVASSAPASNKPGCDGRTTGFFASDPPDFPARNVSWCDADAYCTWAGKHLCGKVGGGELNRSASQDPSLNEWLLACSNAGTTKFAYGDTFDATRCNVRGNGDAPRPIRSFPMCTDRAGVVDLIGNVWEWTAVCDDTGCAIFGGSYFDTSPQCFGTDFHTRTFNDKNVGFRCCATP